MGTISDEFLVDRVVLVALLAGEIIKEKDLGGAEAIVYDVALLSAGRHAEMRATHRFDFRKSAQAFEQPRQIFLGVRILQPEENMVNQLRIGAHGGGCSGI